MGTPDNLVLDFAGDIFAGSEFCIDSNVFAELHESASRLIVSASTAATEAAHRTFSGKTIYLEANLAQLSHHKSVLADQISELKEDAKYQFEISYPTPETITVADFNFPGPCQPYHGPVCDLSSEWPGCGADVFEFRMGSVDAAMISLFCPFCTIGYFARKSDFGAALPFLSQLRLLQKIWKAEKLLSIVLAAIVILRSMRTATVVPFVISISHRQFFFHHGAHPPAERSIGSSGLFVGRGFQTAAAA